MSEATTTMLVGDCREVLRSLPPASVHVCVTSPPYYGLRDYGTATWEGGEVSCPHRASNVRRDHSMGTLLETRGEQASAAAVATPFKEVCGRCGAKRIDQQIGLEATPRDYVSALVDVFDEIWRVLRDDGTCWLNLGDSFANDGKWGGATGGKHVASLHGEPVGRSKRHTGLKPKDLIGIPWMVAFALRDAGWYLRSDIVWAKRNVMPESVRDRPTRAHEYVFLLTKSERYFYDAEAIREGDHVTQRKGTKQGHHLTQMDGYKGLAGGTLKRDPDEPYGFARNITTVGRNKRSVWTIASQPYPDSHFAVMPEALVEPCILAGTSSYGVCGNCGSPYRRVVEREFTPQQDVSVHKGVRGADDQKPMDASNGWQGWPRGTTQATTTGWEPTCRCNCPDVVPAVVLDPFMGSGTVARVAIKHRRSAIGIDLNPTYATQLATKRLTGVQMHLGLEATR